MMILLPLGVLLIGLVLVDLAMTTLTMQGPGPLSSRIMRAVWGGLLMVHRRRPSHRLLSAGGVWTIVLTVLAWVLLLWAGWSLVFLSGSGAVVEDTTGEPADFWAHLYYAGFTLFTLGLGDYRPVGSAWQVLTALCVANGLLSLTLSVTYLVPIVSAAVEKRKLAALLAGLGMTPRQMLQQNWNGQSFGALSSSLQQLAPLIIHQAQQHLAYPALHHYHSKELEMALPVRLASLDETLTVLQHGVVPEARPDRSALVQTRYALSKFLQALAFAGVKADKCAPEPIPLHGMEGIPIQADQTYEEALRSLEDHRRLMLALVRYDGWTWDDVSRSQGEP